MMGGTLVQITGNNINFDSSVTYSCIFDETVVEATYYTQPGVDTILCVSPLLTLTGRIEFALSYSDPLNEQRTVVVKDTFFSGM